MNSNISSCKALYILACDFSSQRQTMWTDQNNSCHSARLTGSWRRSFRIVGLMRGHCSSKTNCPLSYEMKRVRFKSSISFENLRHKTFRESNNVSNVKMNQKNCILEFLTFHIEAAITKKIRLFSHRNDKYTTQLTITFKSDEKAKRLLHITPVGIMRSLFQLLYEIQQPWIKQSLFFKLNNNGFWLRNPLNRFSNSIFRAAVFLVA